LAVNVAVDLPVATVIETGVVTELSELESFTTKPPEGAGPESVTVPVEEPLPVTELGLTFTLRRTGGFTVKVALCETVPSFPVIVATF